MGYTGKYSGSWAHITHHITLPLKQPSWCDDLCLLIINGRWHSIAYIQMTPWNSVQFLQSACWFFFRLKYVHVEITAIYGSYLIHGLVFVYTVLKIWKTAPLSSGGMGIRIFGGKKIWLLPQQRHWYYSY